MSKAYFLKTGEKIPKQFMTEFNTVNLKYQKHKDIDLYLRDLGQLFGLTQISDTEIEKFKTFLAGFIEGEGSLNISIKRVTTKTGISFDPEFSITQHINGVRTLYYALCVFRTGRLRFKNSSNATLVFIIDNPIQIEDIIIPFYRKHISSFGSEVKQIRLEKFSMFLKLFHEKKHLELVSLETKIIPLFVELRIQSTIKQYFKTEKDVMDYVTSNFRKKI